MKERMGEIMRGNERDTKVERGINREREEEKEGEIERYIYIEGATEKARDKE